MPALANLMNPVEPDPRYTRDHQQISRAQTYPPPPPQGGFGYNHINANSVGQNYGPSFSSLRSNREQLGVPTFQNARPPVFADPPRPHSIQLAPLSVLTATLPPPNGTHGTYSPYPTAYQTSRPDTKLFGGDQQFQPSEGYLPSPVRGSVIGGHSSDGHSNHYGAMVHPHLNPSNSVWKDPVMVSSSSSTTSSTKSSSNSPQSRHWGRGLSPKRSSENVNGRSYAAAMGCVFPNDEVLILHRERVADVSLIQPL